MTAKALLDRLSLPTGGEAEVYVEKKSHRTIGWADRKPQLHAMADDVGVCVRYLHDGAQGMAVSKGLSADGVARLASQAVESSKFVPKDPDRSFFGAQGAYSAAMSCDKYVFERPPEDILETLSAVENRILKTDTRLKKFIKLNYSEEKLIVELANSKGLAQEAEGSSFSFVVEVLAEENGQTEVGWDFRARRFRKDLEMESVVEAVAKHTVQSLGGGPIASGRYSVLLHPRVGTQLLDLVTEALSAEAVQLGRSFWREKQGEVVASKLVHISDDPLLENGLASVPFDDEGVPHSRLDIISSGVLTEYFYDLRTARKAGRRSNGRGIKESLGSLPKPGPTNFFIHAGDQSLEALFGSRGEVFYLHDVMGLHMADPITGEFSLGASGALYKNGRFSKAVRGVTVAGTIGDLFRNVAAVGNDTTWYGSIAAPHLLIDFLTVAGT